MGDLPTDLPTLVAMVRRDSALLGRLFQTNSALALQVTQLLGTPEPGPTFKTNGGAAVHGPVETQGGHFIGRDYIAIIQQCLPQDADEREAQEVIEQYLGSLIDDLSGLRLGKIDQRISAATQTALTLPDIFVPLDTQEHKPSDTTLATWLKRRRDPQPKLSRKKSPIRSDEETRPVSALEALAHHRDLTLLGLAGSGKSTLGAWTLISLARAWCGDNQALTHMGETWPHGALLPVRVELRKFASDRDGLPPGDAPGRAGDIWRYIGATIERTGCTTAARAQDYLQRVARRHGALFLLDGLDECGSQQQRQRVQAAINELATGLVRTKSRFLRTSRPNAWIGEASPEQGVYSLAELDDAKQGKFIERWYEAVVQRGWPLSEPAHVKAAQLHTACREQTLAPIAGNPLLLTLMATLHTNRGRLPDDRADLYRETVELLLMRWNDKDDRGIDHGLRAELGESDFHVSSLLPRLQKVAFQVHQKNAPHVSEDDLKRAFNPLFNGSDDKAKIVIDHIERRAGLLIAVDPTEFADSEQRHFIFPHRTFQEYLAACHLERSPEMSKQCRDLAREAPAHWEIVLTLVARIAGADRGTSAADALVKCCDPNALSAARITPTDWHCALLAGLQLKEIGIRDVRAEDHRQVIADRVTQWLLKSLAVHPVQGDGMRARFRAKAGDVLSHLGDPRFNRQRFYLPHGEDLGFVHIPDHPNLRFARYPVTVGQFRAFVEATEFKLGDPDALHDPDHRPVRYVNWAEARAYCDWLTGTGVLDTGWRADLPDETEWEYAARGGQPADWNYWWGKEADPEKANYDDSGVRDTSVVGCFPANGYGLFDMLGNVWEWTLTPDEFEHEKKKYETRVVRGGSWGDPADVLRCACRLRDHPGGRSSGLGFRVVLRCSPV